MSMVQLSMVQLIGSLQQVQSTLAAMSGTAVPDPGSVVTPSESSPVFDQLVASLTTPVVASAQTVTAAGTVAAGAATGSVTGADVVADASKYVGVPYVLGGTTTSGMDCSGFVQTAFHDLGITMPRLVHEQKLMGTAVPSLADAKPGDLIVFKGGDHIAIYAGNGMVLHAPYPGRTVSLQKLWVGDSGIETIRRIVPPADSSLSSIGATS